jgi:outer membrane protein assembly factor BamB
MARVLRLILVAVPLLVARAPVTADWPQFLGPDRNGLYRGAPIVTAFPAGGPGVVWRKKIGQGLSGPVVVGRRVILFHRIGDREVVESLDAANGTTEWQSGYPTAYRDDFGFDEGPRAVPVVADGVVYTFGAEGELRATGLEGGDLLWSHKTAKEFNVPKGFFGAAGSPLVEGGRVIANVGGPKAGIVAFDAKTGQVQWTATTDQASYSSGIAATFPSGRRAIFLTRNALVGLDPATGTIAFRRNWQARANASVNVATPVVVGDLIFVSAEYGPGAGVLRVDGSNLVELWTSDEAMSNHYATSVHRDGILYGFHGRQEFGPSLRAVELKTGKVRWNQEQFRAGTVTLVGDRLLIVREGGEMILAPASPDAFKPIVRAQILPATIRAYPAVSDGFVYIRNENTLVCLDLRQPK